MTLVYKFHWPEFHKDFCYEKCSIRLSLNIINLLYYELAILQYLDMLCHHVKAAIGRIQNLFAGYRSIVNSRRIVSRFKNFRKKPPVLKTNTKPDWLE